MANVYGRRKEMQCRQVKIIYKLYVEYYYASVRLPANLSENSARSSARTARPQLSNPPLFQETRGGLGY